MSELAVKIKGYYDRGLWTVAMVENICAKGKITAAERDEILGA